MVSAETKLEIINTLRSKKAPYECPFCSRMYRSISGISYHIMKFDHDNPPEGYDPNCIAIRPTPQSPKQSTPVDSSPNRPSRRVNFVTLESPSRHKRQPLTYAEAQRMVEFDLNGEMLRTLITDNLPLEKEVEKVVEENASATPLKQVFTPRHYKSKLKFTRRKSKISQKKDAAKGDSLPRNSLPTPSFREQDNSGLAEKGPRLTTYFRFIEKSAEEMDEEVEYDMDEEDYAWLEIVNEERQKEGSSIITQEVFEMLMDRLEKESHFETQTVNGDPYNLIDEDAVCCICNDGECSNSNVILFCDMCNLAVHQECYGVPYIPEGQWLCKRCLQSPSKPVDCVLCPNKSGAFKQTDDNRWAHVVCALWIPEVCFANTVFLEPVDSIQNIPPARWKLLCYICKKKEGACIQCFKTNCYTAFHVTCAAQASLHMKMEPSRTESGQPSVKKTAFCDLHTPKNSDSSQTLSDEECEISMDMKVTLPKKKLIPSQEDSNPAKDFSKAGVDKPNSRPPIVHIPFVPPHRLSKIASRVAISRKAQFIQMLQSYWMLKRQSRNGVPLLRRLQATSNGVSRNHKEEMEASDQAKALKEQLKYWQQLRHDLERARLLVELIRKREKMKREQYKVQQHITNLQMQPMNFVLKRTLDSLQTKDTSEIFAEPVDIEEVPDYLDHIEHPMDFSTMRRKVENHEYLNFDQFENDFYLMLSNCMSYNEKDTIYYKAAVIMRNLGRPILKGARRKMQLAGIDPDTGLHSEKVLPPCENVGLGDEDVSNMEEKEMTLEEKLRELEEKLEMTATVKSSAGRVSRQKMLRKEIGTIKRKMKKRDRLSFSSHDSSAVAEGPTESRIEGFHTSEEGVDEQEEVKRPKVEPIEECSMLNMAMTSSSFSPPSTPTPTTNAIVNPSPGRSRRSGILFNKGYYRSNGTTPIPVPPNLNLSSESEDGNSLRSPLGLPQFNGLSNNNLERHLYLDQAKINELFSQREPIGNSYSHGNCGRRNSGEHRRFFPNDSADEYQHHDGDKEERHDGLGNSFKTHNGFQETFSETSSEEVLENPKSMDSIDSPYYHCFSGNPGEKVNRKRTYTSSSANSDSEGPGRRRFGGHKRGRKPLKKVYPCSEDFSCIDLEDMQSGIYMIGSDDVGNKALRDPKQDPEVLYPMDLVWAKCRGYPAYPAMIVDPGMPRGFSHHGVPIPVPPIDVLNMRNDCDDFEDRYLVLFFDLRRTWQWLTRCKLEPLGVDAGLDKVKLIEGRKISMRKSVRQAYERALMHRKRVLRNYSDNEVDSESSIEGPS